MDDSRFLECLSRTYGELRDAATAVELTAKVPSCSRLTVRRPGAPRRGGVPAQGDHHAHRGGAAGVAAARAGRRAPLAALGRPRRAARGIPPPRGPALPHADLVRPRSDGGVLDPPDGPGDGDPPDRRRTSGRPAGDSRARRPRGRRRRRGCSGRMLAYGSVAWPEEFAEMEGEHLAGEGRPGRDHGRGRPDGLDGPPVAEPGGGGRRRHRTRRYRTRRYRTTWPRTPGCGRG